MDEVTTAEQDAGGLPFTDAARRLLADARAESDHLKHEYIGTEHLAQHGLTEEGALEQVQRSGAESS